MRRPRVAVLASGGGTTTEVFILSCLDGKIDADTCLVISNHANPGVFEKVHYINKIKNQSIQCIHIGKSNFPELNKKPLRIGCQTKPEEAAILAKLKESKIDLVILLGYMKRVGSSIVKEYGWMSDYISPFQARMINAHPGLLPATKGLFGVHVQENILKSGASRAGHCIFAVDDEYDDGPIISEHEVGVDPNDTPESLFEKIQVSEKKYLAEDIQQFIQKQQKYNMINSNEQ